MRSTQKIVRCMCFYLFVIGLFLLGTFLGNHTVSVLTETMPTICEHTIVIDAGHGGEDGGAVSCTGKQESAYNLEIAIKMDDLLHLLGRDTRMIRKTDTSVYTNGETIAQKKISDLKERVRICNQKSGNVLLSIHQNQFTDSRYRGAQVFYAVTSGSQTLAKELQDAFVSTVNSGSHRECKQGNGIYLLEKIRVPGVLVECGFLSNPAEESWLASSEYQKKLCVIIASRVSSWLDES